MFRAQRLILHKLEGHIQKWFGISLSFCCTFVLAILPCIHAWHLHDHIHENKQPCIDDYPWCDQTRSCSIDRKDDQFSQEKFSSYVHKLADSCCTNRHQRIDEVVVSLSDDLHIEAENHPTGVSHLADTCTICMFMLVLGHADLPTLELTIRHSSEALPAVHVNRIFVQGHYESDILIRGPPCQRSIGTVLQA